MSATPDICLLTAVEMAAKIRAKELSAHELMSAHLKQIERVNPRVNAIVTLIAEQALERARTADERQARGERIGPLHGLPIAHKDLQPTRGVRTTFGSRIYKDFVPQFDSLLVERVREAGAILVGKTNTPEFGAGSQTFNEVFGATLNPYDTTKTCGGSSGGAAVALACRMLPIADGGDLGGSLRNPANFCNVVGFRPSPGRVPAWPTALGWSPLSVEGPMARTVAEVAFFLSALAGLDERSPISIDEPGAKFAQPLGRDFRGVRVAWWKDLGGLPVDARVREVMDAQCRVFESLGCVIEQAEPDFTDADETFKTLRFATSHLASVVFPERIKHRELVKDTILWEVDQGEKLTGADVMRAEMKRTEIYHRMRHFFDNCDFFVLPVSQVLPFDVREHYPTEIEGVKMETYIDWMKSCYYISLTACPAISVPCGFTSDGLPVGIQIVGRHRDDFGLLQMAHAFEQARDRGRVLSATVT
ncbi:MAG TPA: amidase [Bryobacteraceae bacterium]|nr:amidase [Bryobacteraceae bacterium]